MIDTNLITSWLKQPHRLSPEQMSAVADCLEQYPFFVPARYMRAAAGDSQLPFSADMLHEMQLFSGNWLLFHQMMQDGSREPQAPTPAERIAAAAEETTEELIQPVFTENYFLHQGIHVPDEIPVELDAAAREEDQEDEKALMVMMGFDEWLTFLKRKNDRKKSDEEDKAMLKSLWQREKLAAAIDEEDDEIPEAVFEMAINSIDKQETLVSEPLAEIHARQGRYDKAIEIYKKLSLQNPQKKAYFADRIDNLLKEKHA